jgi:histidyl-tRNA synthetase
MLTTLLDELGIRDWKLEINSVGSPRDRAYFMTALRDALEGVKEKMCVDCQRRAETNALRVFDCKVPEDQIIIETLPTIADYLLPDSKEHFAAVLRGLQACGIKYHLNPRLVRGLDYYTRTTFEFTVPDGSGLGTQNALLGGGRYDGLSEMLGGPKAPGIGFAIGEDRLILVLQEQDGSKAVDAPHPEWMWAKKLDAYIAPIGAECNAAALARELRRAGLSVEVGDGTFRPKKSFEAADKIARHIVVLGENELASGTATVKTFATGEQVKVARAELAARLKAG